MASLTRRARRITLLVLDVDGVLTDGTVHVGPEGEMMKVFSLRDGHGIVLAREAGIEVAFLTREVGPFAKQRARKLKIEHLIEGCLDKGAAIRDLAARLGRSADQVAYVGDDVIDLEALAWAGLSACPADAEPEVREAVHFVTERPGGHGAVRDVVRLLLRARGAEGLTGQSAPT
jgi:3-deoxy-D-manno-octulosonate 8-phosphate phosphatase (KDO 8-P phosphatase)